MPSNLQPFVLSEQLCDLGVDLLLLGKIRRLVAAFDQFLDLVLDDLLLRIGFLLFRYVVFVVHRA